MIRLIASDIDGTIINENHVVTKETAELLKKLTDHDIHFVLATGRAYSGAKEIYDQIGFKDNNNGIICLNGLRSYNFLTDEKNELTSLTIEDCYNIEKIGIQYYMGILYCFDETIYLQMDERSFEDFALSGDRGQFRYFREDANLNRINSFQEIESKVRDGNSISKIVFVQSDDYLDLVGPRINQEFIGKYNFMMVGKGWAEIIPTYINKGNTLKAYANALGIAMDEVIAFGDAENDISMLAVASIGVAVGNAMDSVKEIANEVGLSNSENGVIVKIKELIKRTNGVNL